MKDKNILNYIGVFAVALLVAASAVYIYSPVIGSHAGEMTAKVSAVVNPVASLTLDTDNLEFNVSPTIEGSFNSGSITASVNTNSLGGYELYFSSEDDETNMVHDNESVTDVIASDFEGTVTSATMGANKWGYSLDNVDFLKIPALSNQATLRDIDHMPDSSEKNNAVYIGTKISTGLTSGSYSKKVVFSVLAHDNPLPSWGIFNMQDMTSEICNAATIGTTGTLTDVRDGNTYAIEKLKDGKCWMVENLRLGRDTPMTLHPSDSDIASDWELPGSNIESFAYEVDSKALYMDSVHGGYYNFYTISAGEGSSAKTSGDIEGSICPKGWRLPVGWNYYPDKNEYRVLYEQYNSLSSMMDEAGFTLEGYAYHGEILALGNWGRYWSSTVNSDSYAIDMELSRRSSSSSVDIGYPTPKYQGLSARCLAR